MMWPAAALQFASVSMLLFANLPDGAAAENLVNPALASITSLSITSKVFEPDA
jgi:hypothetical protein